MVRSFHFFSSIVSHPSFPLVPVEEREEKDEINEVEKEVQKDVQKEEVDKEVDKEAEKDDEKEEDVEVEMEVVPPLDDDDLKDFKTPPGARRSSRTKAFNISSSEAPPGNALSNHISYVFSFYY